MTALRQHLALLRASLARTEADTYTPERMTRLDWRIVRIFCAAVAWAIVVLVATVAAFHQINLANLF